MREQPLMAAVAFCEGRLPRTTKKETDMTRQLTGDAYDDCFEYHGSTVIEHTRTQAGVTLRRDWIIFDTVEEAVDYFNDEIV
jgi:hypothetical protein